MGYDGRVVFQIDADTKSFDNQIEKVEEELNDLLNRYDETKNMKSFKGKEEDLRQLGVAIEQANNKLVTLRERARKAAEGTSQLGKESKNASNSINLGFGKSLKTLKKVALGIIGVRSAYMAARKAASAYMAQDEELSSKMQSVWVGLGAFLAPLLEMITNLMLKFVGYLNEFIKALTGTDYIARANAKALEKQAKAQAKLNKETEKYQNYDFDVIRTQQSQTSSESGSSADTTSGLIEIPELNQKIVKKLQDLAKWLRENKELIEAVGIALGITFGAVAIAKILGGIASLIGSGALMTGLLGLLAVLGLVAIAWEISLIIKGFKELEEANRIAKETLDNLIEIENRTNKKILENPDNLDENVMKEIDKHTQAVVGDVESSIRNYKSAQQAAANLQPLGEIANWIPGVNVGALEEAQADEWLTRLQDQVYWLIQYSKAGRLTKDGYKALLTLTQNYSNELADASKIESEYKFNIQDVYDAMNNYLKSNSQAIDDIFDLGTTTDNTRRKIDKLVQDFLDGKISVTQFATELAKIPKETKTTMKVDKKQATVDTNDYKNTINSVPNEKGTKMNADEKTAKNKIEQYKLLLSQLPTHISTQLEVHSNWNIYDLVEQLKQTGLYDFLIKIPGFSKLRGFASGGYVSQPTLAMVGEGRSKGEYMIPDGEDYISRLASEIGQYGGGGGTTNVYLDGRLIQRQINNTQNRINFTKNR